MTLAPPLEHLWRLSDDTGTIEHATGDVPQLAHGYCVDDVARVLLVAGRAARLDGDAADPRWRRLAEVSLAFLQHMARPDGRFHNRRAVGGEITDEVGSSDCWGRAVHALGETATGPWPDLADAALGALPAALEVRSSHPRSMAEAALGAAALVVAGDERVQWAACGLLSDAVRTLRALGPADASDDAEWPWPEPRLSWGNALLPDALVAAGTALDDRATRARGLAQLGWLADQEHHDGHLSVTPVGGRGPGDPRPGFDQQPIEVATLADAGLRAWLTTGDERWRTLVFEARAWFEGDNDVGVAMGDPDTGAGFDGLEVDGRNDNRGAESTLAYLATSIAAARAAQDR